MSRITSTSGRSGRTPPAAAVDRTSEQRCEVGELFMMLGQPHMLRLLHAFRDAPGVPLRFSELQQRLALSPRTLSLRLRRLVEAGFVVRRAYRETPPRVEYEVTDKSTELDPLFEIMSRWAGRNSMQATASVTFVGRLPA